MGRSLCIKRGINYFNVSLYYGRTLVEARLEELIPTIANIQATEDVLVHAFLRAAEEKLAIERVPPIRSVHHQPGRNAQ